jgi:hypothetical protein
LPIIALNLNVLFGGKITIEEELCLTSGKQKKPSEGEIVNEISEQLLADSKIK